MAIPFTWPVLWCLACLQMPGFAGKKKPSLPGVLQRGIGSDSENLNHFRKKLLNLTNGY
jgi:hypothetical protein